MDDTPQASPQESAASELSGLQSDADFVADFTGGNGRVAQVEAASRKSALTKLAHGPEEEPAPAVIPPRIEEGLSDQNTITRASSEAMIPGQATTDYSFTWEGAESMDVEALQDMSATAAEAALAVGASPEFTKSTINGLQSMLRQSSGVEPTESTMNEALAKHFGDNADATVTAAKATLALMPERSREWALDTAAKLDATGASWFIGRLASVHKANAPKP
jgi:hypothetical protein